MTPGERGHARIIGGQDAGELVGLQGRFAELVGPGAIGGAALGEALERPVGGRVDR